VPAIDTVSGLVAGLAGGVVVVAVRQLFERQPALAGRRAGLAAVVVPVAVAGILVFVVGRVVVG
jgi:hypothetical protein